MYPLTHFLISFLIGLILAEQGYFTFIQAIITGFVGLLIDMDHFIYYFAKKRDFNLRKAWNAVVRHTMEERTFIHHLPGFLISTFLLLILFFINKIWFWILFIGYYSHILLDYLNFRSWLKVKKKIKFKEEGFIFKIPLYEIILDFILIISILITLPKIS